MKRWMRRVLRRYRIDLPFTGVVCPEHVKTIAIREDGRTDVTVRRALVFLELPDQEDLRDVLPIPAADSLSVIHESPDSHELLRTASETGTLVYWSPREPLVRYGLYVHEHGWTSAGSHDEAAVYTEFHCETRTGTMRLEISIPGTFEAAVVFPRPRWRRMADESGLVKHALRMLDEGGERPELLDGGTRLQWTLTAPKIGARYVCVAFHQDGIAQWQQRLQAQSFKARLLRLLGADRWLPATGGPRPDPAANSPAAGD